MTDGIVTWRARRAGAFVFAGDGQMSTPALKTLRSAASIAELVLAISFLVLAMSVLSSSARLLGNERSSRSVDDTERSSLDVLLACWVNANAPGRFEVRLLRRVGLGATMEKF